VIDFAGAMVEEPLLGHARPGDVFVDADVLWEPILAAKEAVLQRNTLCAATPSPLTAAACITHREV
jgi:hypothetical protein